MRRWSALGIRLAPIAAVIVYFVWTAAPSFIGLPLFGAGRALSVSEAAAVNDLAELQLAIWNGGSVRNQSYVAASTLRREHGMTVTPVEAAMLTGAVDALELLLMNGLWLDVAEARSLGCAAFGRKQDDIVALLTDRFLLEVSAEACVGEVAPF